MNQPEIITMAFCRDCKEYKRVFQNLEIDYCQECWERKPNTKKYRLVDKALKRMKRGMRREN